MAALTLPAQPVHMNMSHSIHTTSGGELGTLQVRLAPYGSPMRKADRTPLQDQPIASTSTLPRSSITLDGDYFERRHLRQQCTQRFLGEDFRPQASEIIPGIYLADMYTATDPLTLKRLGITHVVSAAAQTWHRYPAHIRHLCLPIQDVPTANLFGYLTSVVAWMKSAVVSDPNAKVMVHCVWGMSRSASVVIAYLMTVKGMSLVNALALVRLRRRVVRPNAGFLQQLLMYELMLRRDKTKRRGPTLQQQLARPVVTVS